MRRSKAVVACLAAALLAVERGAAVVRMHDVRETVAALAVWRAMQAESSEKKEKESS